MKTGSGHADSHQHLAIMDWPCNYTSVTAGANFNEGRDCTASLCCHVVLLCSMSHLADLLSRLVGGEVKLFTTPCVNKELKALGAEYEPAAKAARQHQLHKCEHDPPQLPSDCLLSAVAKGNPDHWWIATQDKVLQVSGQDCWCGRVGDE